MRYQETKPHDLKTISNFRAKKSLIKAYKVDEKKNAKFSLNFTFKSFENTDILEEMVLNTKTCFSFESSFEFLSK